MGYFKNAQIVLEDIREFGTCRASVDASHQSVRLHYRLQDDRIVRTGVLVFLCEDESEFRRRVLAAATSARNGDRQIDFQHAANTLWDGVKPHALRILTNSTAWRLIEHTEA